MSRRKRIPFVALALLALLCACGQQDSLSPADSIAYPEVWEALHAFNWMDDDASAGKPFLAVNGSGVNAKAGIIEMNGETLFFLATFHFPRSVPVVELFTVEEKQLVSVGGFFENKYAPYQLSFYEDEHGQPLFVHEVIADFGGTRTTLVATYLENYHTIPIASMWSYYDLDNYPRYYYVYPEEKTIESLFLYGDYDGQDGVYEVSETEYHDRVSAYLGSLSWTHDISYEPSVYYHYSNYCDLGIEIRYEEIREAFETGREIDFQSEEEMKKTSDLVADALYEAYVSGSAVGD